MPNLNRAAPLKPMQIITTDFMGPVPRATPSGNKYALVIIDHFTKWVEIYPTRTKEAKQVARSLVKFVCRHGIPEQIISDQGKEFQNEIMEKLCEHSKKSNSGISPSSRRVVGTLHETFKSYD